MLTLPLRRYGGAVVATVLAASLIACAAEPGLDPGATVPTMAPEQSIGEACDLATTEVDSIVEEAKGRLDEAGKALAAGQIPDLGSFADALHRAIERARDGVINPEVLGALDEVRGYVDGFADISTPASLLEVPGYLSALGTQFGQLRAAGQQLSELCSAG